LLIRLSFDLSRPSGGGLPVCPIPVGRAVTPVAAMAIYSMI
jgi:hypothetical protein